MKKSDQDTDRRIGAAIKAERKRLGLSTSALAYHCKTSAVTIWSWEVGKAKAPMRCLVTLAALGFDPDAILPWAKTEAITLDRFTRAGRAGRIDVERHRLARLIPSIDEGVEWDGYAVYHNLDWLNGLTEVVPGSLCLVDRHHIESLEGAARAGTEVFLLRHPASGVHSLASAKLMRNGRIRFTVGSASLEGRLSDAGTRNSIVGRVLGSVGTRAPDSLEGNRHEEALIALVEATKGRAKSPTRSFRAGAQR